MPNHDGVVSQERTGRLTVPTPRQEEPERPLMARIPKTTSLRVQAYEHIKAAIIAGDVEPERLYSVNQFAELLGVSRTPVREALLDLDRQGLLRMDRNRGFHVLPMTPVDLAEIIELRRFLEVPAIARLAALHPAPVEVFDRAREIYEALQREADEGNLLEFLTLDRRFHLALIDALGNSRLTRLVGELRDQMHLPGLRRLAAGGQLHESGREHLELLEALEAGDSVAAAAIMQAHLDRTQREWS
jgi:DNA-binding GntR family transcriptional regulator